MRARKLLALALAMTVAAAGLAACGGGSGGEPPEGRQPGPEQAFLQSMVPHHDSAVQMARVADAEATTPFVKRLAADIERSQTAEISRMRRIHERLFGAPLKPDMGAHMALGLSAQEAGMDHMDGAAMVRGKRPFDRAFVDEMVPHHEGAMRMARVVLEKGRDPELRRLAQDIIAAQKKEIEDMKRFRQREFGSSAPTSKPPAGGHTEHRGG